MTIIQKFRVYGNVRIPADQHGDSHESVPVDETMTVYTNIENGQIETTVDMEGARGLQCNILGERVE